MSLVHVLVRLQPCPDKSYPSQQPPQSHPQLQRRAALLAGATVAGTAVVWKDDLTQLQFELASATGPALRMLDAETSHNIGIWAMRNGLMPRETRPDPPSLTTSVWGRQFTNPIGVLSWW